VTELVRNLFTMVRLSFEADRVRSIVALTSTGTAPATHPLRAIGLGLFTDGVLRNDRSRAMTGALMVAGLTGLDRILLWISLTVRMRLREHTILHLDEKVMALTAGVAGLEHHERPEHQDKLELLRVNRSYLVNPFMPVAWTAASLIQMAATVVVLGALHPVLALLPVAGVPSLLLNLRVETRKHEIREEEGAPTRLIARLRDLTVQAAPAKEVRIFGLADELIRRHGQTFSEMEQRQRSFNVRSGLVLSAGWTLFAVGYMAAVAFVVSLAVEGRASVGAVVLTLSMGAQMNSQLAELVANFGWFSRTAHAVGLYRWLARYADEARTALERPDRAPVPGRLHRGITVVDLSFAYPGTRTEVLGGVNLELPAGATVAIVGENGAGKTTLVKLLCRFYEPTSGQILVDGVDLHRFDVDEWRARVSAGFQDFARLQLTAQRSVGVGDLAGIDDEAAVLRALERAAASDLLAALPGGLAVQLGTEFDTGHELSLGQWQKVALGRAMMRTRPLLLVLDEPTASLDAPTEHALFERFSGAAREVASSTGALTILVSHRFSTVRMADLIVVVDGGRVREAGSHSELMAAGDLYAELYTLQARGYR
jgi:ATP-binding cassette, subfamily B, bacterial